MRSFTYERATDARAAVAAVSRNGAKFISGGTNLLDLMKLDIEKPSHLVDISRLPLRDIEELPDGGLRIGAQAANSDVAADARVRTRYPVLSEALVAGASGQLRNKASTGEICCSALAARTSTTRLRAATSEIPVPGARRSAGSTGFTPSSAPATPASPPIPRTWPSR